MEITLEQARAFEATARLGTVQKAAHELHKGHSAVLYLIRSLEKQIGFALFDRSGYRNAVSHQGEVVLKYCRDLLNTKAELTMACARLSGGWEPRIQLIYDGVVDFNLIADALLRLRRDEVPSEINIRAAYLNEVEQEFIEKNFDLMVTILPIRIPEVTAIKLKPINMLLVAHARHPLHLVKSSRKLTLEDLKDHTQVAVRESAGQLGLSTERAEFSSTIQVNDFPTKRDAIMRGLGFGWLPEYAIQNEIKGGRLKVLKTNTESKFQLHPKLYHRKAGRVGRGVERLIANFKP